MDQVAMSAPGGVAGETDPLDEIEIQAAVLRRNFELLRRRSDMGRELDRAEYLLLRTLDRLGPADINTLAAALGLDPSTAGRQVAAAEIEGRVERTPSDNDRRRSIVTPTAEGARVMREAGRKRRASIADLLAGWSEEDLRTLSQMFRRYNDAVTECYLTDE